MTFYVEKRLPLGAISFGVTPDLSGTSSDDDRALSTGASGEFIRRRGEGFFFGGPDRFAGPTLPKAPSLASTPFWSSFKSDRPSRTYGFLALMFFGFLLVLVGFAVIGRKGPQGWAEVILGVGMIATPIVLTAQKRRKLREQEAREREEREVTEKRNRDLLAAYTTALDGARTERGDEAFATLEREREALILPYDIWAAAARRAVLLIGFDELAKRGPGASKEIAQTMDRAARAAGLTPEDQTAAKRDLVRTVAWHLLADNRLGAASTQELAVLRNGLGVADDDARTVEQFRRFQGLTPQRLPRAKCSTKLGFQEYCIYETPTDRGTLHVTNRRVIVEAKKRLEMPIAHAFAVVADADDNVVTIKTGNPKKPLRLRVDEPIYTAAILHVASTIDERPRGFS